MYRIVSQLKKRIDNIDFRKIYKGFTKCNFLLRYDGILYDLMNKYIDKNKNDYYTIINDITYAIIDYPIGNLNYNQLVIELVCVMFKIFWNKKNFNFPKTNELKYLITEKNLKYYELKYKQNLLLARLLNSKTFNKNELDNLEKMRIKNNNIVLAEITLEQYYGIENYIKLRTTYLVDKITYQEQINKIINVLEDPTKILDYFSYIKIYGAALLLVKNQKFEHNTIFSSSLEDNLIINFNNLLSSNETKIRRIMMYKMIHARKVKILGKLSNAKFEKILNIEDLYYLPEMIEYVDNNQVKTKKGDFIIKMNKDLDIIESYECLSINKIT